MKYAYYPGCSLTSSAEEYDISTRRVLKLLGAEVEEIPDWTCCGAGSVESVSLLLSQALPARNLALAERDLPGMEVLAPCSACYLNLYRARQEALSDRKQHARVSEALDAEGLTFAAVAPVRHLLDVLANDIGPIKVHEACTRDLGGLKVAPYYGCQALRPYPTFDDPNRPRSMEGLLRAVGAEPLEWDVGARCCGASLMVTHKEAALDAVGEILAAAKGADAIATVCPMCQMNLEAYQKAALGRVAGAEHISVLYLPQILGIGLGLSPKQVMLDKNLALSSGVRARLEKPGMKPVEPSQEAAGKGEEEYQPPLTGG
ncbi:MAG: CoB--CoM heterodisulfide reductase iron-sulfur subunit B family protein [Desulfovibrionaceae bacterium]